MSQNFLRLEMLGICFKGVCEDLFGFWGGLWWFVMWFVVFSATLITCCMGNQGPEAASCGQQICLHGCAGKYKSLLFTYLFADFSLPQLN